MPANGAVYIQRDKIDLADIFDGVKSDKGIFRKASYYDIPLNGDVVRFNIMTAPELSNHINGFLGYISSLDQDERRKKDTSYAISHTMIVLGLSTDKEFEENHSIWKSLFDIADKYDGFVFVHDSVLLPSGTVLVGPLLDSNT
ncbi:hypothetical protein ACRWQM_14535 [Shewanella sp. HL-SH5]|uniref:hypothetical protein n=1 Tax=Shewanella sp. HL-SH5 TaxID=3436241 RepID=UPI003EB7317D